MADLTTRLAARREMVTRAPLRAVLVRLTVPTAVWYLLNYSFFVADTYFVARLGTDALAAMGMLSAVVVLITTLAQGFASALAAIAAIYLGAGQHEPTAKLVTHTLVLGAAVALAVPLIGIPTIEPLFVSLGATPAQLPAITQYMTITYAGFVFTVVPTIGQAGIRATGDVTTPALILLVSGALNIALDPLLIFGGGPVPALGVSGAAIATLVSRVLGTGATLYLLARRDRLIDPSQRTGLRESWVPITRIGLPVACQMASLALASAILLRVAAGIDQAAVAGLGVGLRIEAVLHALVFGLPVILPTFIGQNTGAGAPLRAGQGTLIGARLVFGCQLALAAVLALAAEPLARAFSDELAVRGVIEHYLWLVPVGSAAHTYTTATAGTFIALGRIRHYLAISMIPAGVTVLACIAGTGLFGIVGLIGTLSVSRIVTGIVASFWLRRTLGGAGLLPLETQAPTPAGAVG